jgi:PhoH-like ATPase
MIQRKPASNVARFPSTSNKLFVLDTNVLMHDPTSLFRFEEHDVYIPIAILEELDNNKKGMSEVARNARQASRYLDELVSSAEANIADGIPIERHGDKSARGKLFLQTEAINGALPARLPTGTGKADNQIIGVVMHLQDTHPKREVILVSKDINMRIKARAVGLAAEDYFNDKVLEDTDLLYSGTRQLPADFWAKRRHVLPGARAARAEPHRQ